MTREPDVLDMVKQSQEQAKREKDELRLQVRLIAYGAFGDLISDNSEIFAYAEKPWRVFNKILSVVYRCKPLFKSIDMAVEGLFNEGIRAIKP